MICASIYGDGKWGNDEEAVRETEWNGFKTKKKKEKEKARISLDLPLLEAKTARYGGLFLFSAHGLE